MPNSFDTRFELLDPLGKGEFATVFRARQKSSSQLFAMKIANSALSLEHEYELARSCVHPNVIAVHELGSYGDASAFTMAIARGTDFVTHARHDIPLTQARGPHLPMAFGQPLQPVGSSVFSPCTDAGIARLRAALVPLVRAIMHLHSVGLVHRDLRPSNVRIDDDHQPHVIDFGLAARIGEDTPTVSLGAPSHFAPEDSAGGAVHPASDWYALGVLVFEALTGELPFAGTGQDVLLRKQTVSAPRPSFFVDKIPNDLDEICAGLLAPSRSLRFNGEACLSKLGAL